MSLLERHQVQVHGHTRHPTLVLVNGYGCDQTIWRHLLPLLSDREVVTYEQAGSPAIHPDVYDPVRHARLDGYAEDLIGICEELGLQDVVVVGHSISAMTGILAHLAAPELVIGLVLVAAAPHVLQDGTSYPGAFSRTEVEEMLAGLRENFADWAAAMGPEFMGNPERPELAAELVAILQRNDPTVMAALSALAFLSDLRSQLPEVQCPTLVVQPSADPLTPEGVGEYVRDQIPLSSYAKLLASGHFPHVSAPAETAAAIEGFLAPIASFLRRTRA